MNIDKSLVQKAVDEAFEKIIKENEKYDDDDLIYSDEIDKNNNENDGKDEKDVQDKIEEEVEKAVDENPKFNFLGVDIEIEKTDDDKYNVKMSKDGKEKSEVLDSIELTNVLGLIEEFFNELVLGSEDEDEFDSSEDESDSSEDESSEIFQASLSSLRKKYKNKIEEIFEHGLMAKQLALGMIRENLTRNTVKELVDTIKEKDSIIVSKKMNLQQQSVKYLLAKKMESELKKANALLSEAVKDLNKKIESKDISPAIAKDAIERYSAIVSTIVNADNPKVIAEATRQIGKIQKAILANVYKANIYKNKINIDENDDDIKLKPRNVLNRTGKNSNTSLLSDRRYDGIDEMSAEILRIAGIKED